MRFREFSRWCNERACDGMWSAQYATRCISIYEEMRNIPFWKREKVWREKYEDEVTKIISNIDHYYKNGGN